MTAPVEPSPPTDPTPPASPLPRRDEGSTRKRLLGVALILALLAALLTCLWPVSGQPFDYLRVKAAELGHDRARVLAFVRDEVADLPYRGDVKGALGTLWEGAGSPEERLALANGLLAHCPGAAPAALADLGAAAAGEAPACSVSVVHRALLAAGDPRETEVYAGAIGALVGGIHSVRVLEAGTSVVEVGGEAPRQVKVQVQDAVGEELVFRLALPGRAAPLEVVRELWRAGNRVGLDAQAAGDLHVFTVWPCRVGDYVREKEDLRLTESGRFETPLGELYRRLLDFAHTSDEGLAKVEAAYATRARFDQPRILWLSRIEHDGQVGQALDLRHDDVTFTGATEVAWQAANARGWLEAELEGRFLREALKAPVTTAWTVFQRLQDTRPDAPGRRLRLAGAALGALARRDDWREVRFEAGGSAEGEPPRVT
ncbi:MAG: hypothetical protein KDD82_31640, partial [Planctomycetes bacterium]|nr:hypothetical protein [Planctomycetota bacterium]